MPEHVNRQRADPHREAGLVEEQDERRSRTERDERDAGRKEADRRDDEHGPEQAQR